LVDILQVSRGLNSAAASAQKLARQAQLQTEIALQRASSCGLAD